MVGETADYSESSHTETLSVLETNFEDLSPQILGHFMERALAEGALDCWFTPIQMKKNRPATLVSVLCHTADERKFLELFYRETSTIGVRVRRVQRHSLEREVTKVETEFGNVDIKKSYLNGEAVNSKPEFEDLKAAAAASGVSVKTVADAVAKK
jgi:hypothetical protein